MGTFVTWDTEINFFFAAHSGSFDPPKEGSASAFALGPKGGPRPTINTTYVHHNHATF